jgi:hypothetical protein
MIIVDINHPECDVKKLFDNFIMSDFKKHTYSVDSLDSESFELGSVINWINNHNGQHWMNIYDAQKLCDAWVACKFITRSTYLCTGLGLERFNLVCELGKPLNTSD